MYGGGGTKTTRPSASPLVGEEILNSHTGNRISDIHSSWFMSAYTRSDYYYLTDDILTWQDFKLAFWVSNVIWSVNEFSLRRSWVSPRNHTPHSPNTGLPVSQLASYSKVKGERSVLWLYNRDNARSRPLSNKKHSPPRIHLAQNMTY